MKRTAPHILKSTADILKPVTAKVVKEEVDGYPDVAIMEWAEETGADLIVMGTKGIKGIRAMFIGSVTRSVAINSVKPVLVTRHTQSDISSHMKVLLATDGSDSAIATAGFLASMPLSPDTEIIILHVAWSALSVIPEQFSVDISKQMKDDAAQIETKEHDKAGRIIEKSRVCLGSRFGHIEVIMRSGDPSLEILHSAEEFGADMIAVGCRGLQGIKGMMGSVSRRILGKSPCPVLIGKVPAS